MEKVKVETQCSSCGGTGLYSGMGERDGLAVVCTYCDGSGKRILSYTPFTGRQPTEKVQRAILHNPGVCLNPELVGDAGLSYKDWAAGKPFPKGSELREWCCPLWWSQVTDNKRLDWDKCGVALGRAFSDCPHYSDKAACWEKYDAEKK